MELSEMNDTLFQILHIHYKDTLYSIPKPFNISAHLLHDSILQSCGLDQNTSFLLSDSKGYTVDISNLKEDENYTLNIIDSTQSIPQVPPETFQNFINDTDPLQHSEVLKALQLMKEGSNMLKHTRNGLPHIRLFQLTSDLTRLLWYTDNPDHNKSCVDFREVKEVSIGQKSDTFKKYSLPKLEHLSFTLYYKDTDLSITCKDEKEFDFWVAGCKALYYHFKNLRISKQVLLSHSRRLVENMKVNKVADTSVIFQNATSTTLNEFIVRRPLTLTQVREKIIRAREKHNILVESAKNLPEKTGIENLVHSSDHKLAYGRDYCGLVLDEEQEEVYATHECTLAELLECNQQTLISIENQYELFMKTGLNTHPKELENQVWAVEIDIENASDIINRITNVIKFSWRRRMRNWLKVKLSI